MNTGNASQIVSACQEQGFTIFELVVAVLVSGILLSMAIPVAAGWMNSIEHRKAARELLYALRDARMRTLAQNREHRAEIEPERNRYRIIRGNRSLQSSEWSTIALDWTVLPEGVHIASNVRNIHFNPSGTANAGTIRIQDSGRNTRYEVRVTRTGRIRMPAF